MANDLIAYEEEKQLTEKINAIIEQKDFALNKIKKLESLRETVTSPLTQSHIDYYSQLLRSDMRMRVARVIGFIIVAVCLIFILFRVYWFYNPENNPFHSGGNSLTVTDMITWVYYISFRI